MSKIKFMRYFMPLLHLTAVATIYLALIAAFGNQRVLVIDMHTPSASALSPKLYYARSGEPFSETRHILAHKVLRERLYYFSLPDLSTFNYVRFDPDTRPLKNITIARDMLIIETRWFHKTVYKLDAAKAVPAHQINRLRKSSTAITFDTIGHDPQINLNFTKRLFYTTRTYHLDMLLGAVALYLLLVGLYRLRKSTFDDRMSAKLILYALFLAFAFFKATYYKEKVNFIYTPDVVAHFSYVKDMAVSPTLTPDFYSMYMVTNKNAGNYLGHPPLYYLTLSLAYDTHATSVRNMDSMQRVNIMIFVLGVVLLVFLMFQSDISILAHFVYLTILTSIPMHAYLGMALTNDNLAYLGSVLFIFALKRFLEKDDTVSYLWLLIGIFIAYFSKLTAALLIFFALLYLAVWYLRTKSSPHLTKQRLFLAALFLLPIVTYQAYIFIHYHAVVPTLNITHPQEYLHSVYFIPEEQRHYKTFFEWLKLYWHNIESGWFAIHSHHSLSKSSPWGYAGLLIFHLFALVGLLLPCNEKNRTLCLVGKVTILALFSVAAIQILFGYKTHLHSGYTGGLQPRYLLPFMVGFAIMASLFVERFKNCRWCVIAVIAVAVHAIYSDFFYFLLYYR